MPELLPLVTSAYGSPSSLFFGKDIIWLSEGVQQGDPIGPLLFCLTIHDMVQQLCSEVNVFFLDDSTLGGSLEEVLLDLDLEVLGSRLQYLHSHDAFCLLRHALTIPKVLYTLRSSPCSLSPVLQDFDTCLRSFLNIDLSDSAWTQASPCSDWWIGSTKCHPACTCCLPGLRCGFSASHSPDHSIQAAQLPLPRSRRCSEVLASGPQ